MKNRKKTTILRLLMAIAICCYFSGCNSFDDYDEAFFTIQCQVDDEETMYIYFSTTSKTFPEVTINGESMSEWYIDDGDIQGDIYLEYDDDIEYSVTEDGKTTSGTISFSESVDEIECNNEEIEANIYYIENIEQDNSYNFEWDDVECDYQLFYCGYTLPQTNAIFEPTVCEYTIEEDNLEEYYQDSYFYVYIYTVNGARLASGETANVDGKYGQGFVYAQNSNLFKIDLYSTNRSSSSYSSKSSVIKKIPKEERRKIFHEKFKAACALQ